MQRVDGDVGQSGNGDVHDVDAPSGDRWNHGDVLGRQQPRREHGHVERGCQSGDSVYDHDGWFQRESFDVWPSCELHGNGDDSDGDTDGTVQFNVDGGAFGSPAALVSGSATSGSIATLTQGTHTVTAVYSGDTDFATSTGALGGGQVVSQATAATVVTSSVNRRCSGSR